MTAGIFGVSIAVGVGSWNCNGYKNIRAIRIAQGDAMSIWHVFPEDTDDTDVIGDIEEWARSELDTGVAERGWCILSEEALLLFASDEWIQGMLG